VCPLFRMCLRDHVSHQSADSWEQSKSFLRHAGARNLKTGEYISTHCRSPLKQDKNNIRTLLILFFREVLRSLITNFNMLTLQNPAPTIYTTFCNRQQLSALSTEYICVFHMILPLNSDYFHKQHKPFDLCTGDTLCFL
jgi:hypothetical protein